jgi:uncharacterized iron-regulated protein
MVCVNGSFLCRGVGEKMMAFFKGISTMSLMLGVFVTSMAFLSPFPCFSVELPQVVTSLSFDMEKRVVEGKSSITFPDSGERRIHTGSLKIKSVRYRDHSVDPVINEGMLIIEGEKGGVLDMEYECASKGQGPCSIDTKGIVLTGKWYPSVEGLAYHRLKALVPRDFTAISEAEEIVKEKTPGGNLFTFAFPHPVEGITFVAARFSVTRETFRGIELYAYFFPEDKGLAKTYLEHAKKYLGLYEGMMGKYPYKRFSVVENILPTGYPLPTFTLLGQDVVRLPFIVNTSLGHEILHQWLGNLVYVDYEKGNWSEGLTAYLSDHLYEEREGRGWQYRKQTLIDYETYVNAENEFPLRDFRSGTDPASRAIGYGKGAMVFHMLKNMVGEETFFKSIRKFINDNRFRKASWDDMRTAFEAESGEGLDQFFGLWLNENGYPSLELTNTEMRPKGRHYAVSFDIVQKEKPFLLDLAVSVKTEGAGTKHILRLYDKKQNFEILSDGKPEELVIDEHYDIFRKLTPEETPPVIGRLLNHEKGLMVLPSEGKGEIYSGVVKYFEERGYEAKKPKEVGDKDVKRSPLVLLGCDNPVISRLFGKMDDPSPGLVLRVRKNPFDSLMIIGVVNASSGNEIDIAWEKIPHYGNYSLVAFKEGKNIQKRIEESQSGWDIPLGEPVVGIEVPKTRKLPDIINNVSDKKIVYVGEHHTSYEHHLTQLETIRGLFRKNPKIAIGMEMFQRPFQQVLDDYIGRKIEEREFLKASEYFNRWGFDYHLYRDILTFAREEKIPVVALNIKKEIVDKVSRNGIDSLSEEEKEELPDSMDMSDEEYRERLKEVFEKHEGAGSRDFDNFYQSQIIWDEIMAQSIDEYLRKNPDRKMVIIAGSGHIAFKSGIPKRVFRRNGLEYAVLLNDNAVETGIADFVLFPHPVKTASAPKLMALLSEEGGKVTIKGFPDKSVSEKAGLEKGDVIISLDNEPVKGVDDIKIFLFYKKPGDTIEVRVLRKRFLFGDRELSFKVML